MSKSLSLQSVDVAYCGNTVVSQVNLDVKSGEIFGLIGLNGVGKTTIIKSILGLREQDRGDIFINGHHKSSNLSRAGLAYLPEKFEPPWFLSGLEFIHFSLSLYKTKISDQEIFETAEQLAFDQKALKRRVNTYSKGMRQKLGLIATIKTGANLFILDEPMSGLDPLARALVKKMILNMRHNERTIFLSSHVLADLDEICDRVALLHDGKIRFVGAPAELKTKTNTHNLEQAFLEFIEYKTLV